ncbi:ABC transporter ATP-binding protein [Rubrobacter taiwanensis]|uniref:ABC transporter ATP-binding protein n=1 Tax=Rubrobacter taiwanensis TaxID=185139 RepID=UPI001404E486|nr:ABC transporter ATP-binding protein [Rubrobacter taiwanensis]
MAVLEAENITLTYRSSGRGVENASLRVEAGEIFGLMGPNGSGKSTLLRVLTTAMVPDSGSLRVCGMDALKDRRRVRARLGIMVDRPTHYGDLSGWANAYFFARAYGLKEKKAEAALAELFEHFDLDDYRDDRAKTYSYGMSKKLALIEAMAHGPDLLLLDEPSLGLDYTSQLAYQRKVRELAAAGAAVLIASNQVDEMESLCDRVAFLHRGRIAAEGRPQELVESLRGLKRIEATLRNPVEYGPLAEVAGVRRVVPEGRDLVVHTEDRPGIVAAVVNAVVECGGDIVDLHVRRPNLEDVYVKLTGEALTDE